MHKAFIARCLGAALLACTVMAATTASQAQGTAAASVARATAPTKYELDGSWPKPYPTVLDTATGRHRTWITGEVAGTCVDSRDHVFIVTRGNLLAEDLLYGTVAPPVIEFNPAGDVVASWGDRNVLPNGIHGCFVDYQDNVWIAGNGDGIVQKYSHNGALLLQIGTRGVCDNPPQNTCGDSGSNPAANQSKTLLNQPADIFVDPDPDPVTNRRGSIYIADGYGNHRVAVFDRQGTFLRQWGGVAGTVMNPATDYLGQFGSGGGHPHCVNIAVDGNVYVCDRSNDRIQVFTKTGQLVRVIPVVPGTGTTPTAGGVPPLNSIGSAWDVDFSIDAQQRIMYEADGGNEHLLQMDRLRGTILSSFGQPGRNAGQFTYLHTVARDSKGNLYTGETINGRRIQRFVPVTPK